MITTPPTGIDPDIIGDELTKRVKSNGKRTVNQRLEDIILLLEDARTDLKEIKEMKRDIYLLKKNNIVMWFFAHSFWRKMIISVSAFVSLSFFMILLMHAGEVLPVIIQAYETIHKLTP